MRGTRARPCTAEAGPDILSRVDELPGTTTPEFPAEIDDTSRRAKALWFAFLGLWLLTMLHYGAVLPWAVAATALALALLNGLAMILLPGGIRLSRFALAWLAAVGSVFLLQLLPLGPLLFPATHALRLTHGVPSLMPGTADLFYTIRSLTQLAAYILATLLVLRLRYAGLSISFMMKSLCVVLLPEALYGIIQFTANLGEIPFFGPRVSADSASGTMVNRNTFAGLMAMGIVMAAALGYSRFAWPKGRRESGRGSPRIESGLRWSAGAALFVFALVLSHSRGGALSAAVGVVMIPFLYRGKGSAFAAIGLVAAGAVAVALADPSILVDRFGQLDPYALGEDSRVRIWSTTLQAAMHQPVLGFGVGTHPHAYHPFQPPDLLQDIRHAHNEYINFFFEGGALFAFVMIGGLFAWGWRSWRSMQRLPGPDRFLPTAAICGAAAEAVHSMVDFDCRVTTAGLLLAALVGLAASVVRSNVKPGRRTWGVVALVASIAALSLLLPINTDHLAEQALLSDAEAAESLSRRVLSLSPYHYQAAWVAAKSREKRTDVATAAARYGVAADLWPAHPGLQLDVAMWFWNEWAESADPVYYERSARSFQRLFTQRPGGVEEVIQGIWERTRPQKEYEGLMPTGKPAAWGALASFLASKGLWPEAQVLFDRAVPAVPENVAVFDRFAEALKAAGQWGMEALVRERRLAVYAEARAIAEAARAWRNLEAWDKAAERATQACRIDPTNTEWVTLKGDIYRSKGDKERALEAYVLAVRMSPQDARLLFKRVAFYMEAKMYAEAASDYQQILRTTPGDRTATLGLAQACAANKDLTMARRVLDEWIRKNPGDAQAAAYREAIGP
jgi:O-antigen ligase/tetratricopeptide (TPR) repeat protein